MDRKKLEAPFLAHQVKQREGAYGNVIDYVEGHAVIARLNDALDANWSFDVIEHTIREDIDEALVLGRLTAGEVLKTQFGSSRIVRNRESGKIVSLGDDLKAAATDAMKKCATQLGLGLYLYQGTQEIHPPNEAGRDPNWRETPPSPQNCNRERERNVSSVSRTNHARLSSKQHRYLQNLAKERNLSRRELENYCKQRFRVGLDHLSRAQASGLIENLQNGRVDIHASAPENGAA